MARIEIKLQDPIERNVSARSNSRGSMFLVETIEGFIEFGLGFQTVIRERIFLGCESLNSWILWFVWTWSGLPG